MSPNEISQLWFDFLNREKEAPVVFSEDVVVIYYPDGVGGRAIQLEGLAEVTTWARRGEDGRFVYTPTSDPETVEPRPEIPAGDLAVRVGYRVAATFVEWSNTGDETLHASDGKILAVLHEPDPIPPESETEPE